MRCTCKSNKVDIFGEQANSLYHGLYQLLLAAVPAASRGGGGSISLTLACPGLLGPATSSRHDEADNAVPVSHRVASGQHVLPASLTERVWLGVIGDELFFGTRRYRGPGRGAAAHWRTPSIVALRAYDYPFRKPHVGGPSTIDEFRSRGVWWRLSRQPVPAHDKTELTLTRESRSDEAEDAEDGRQETGDRRRQTGDARLSRASRPNASCCRRRRPC